MAEDRALLWSSEESTDRRTYFAQHLTTRLLTLVDVM